MSTPKVTPLMVTRSHEKLGPEAEPVLVETTADDVLLTLDDGEVLTFSREELAAAVAA